MWRCDLQTDARYSPDLGAAARALSAQGLPYVALLESAMFMAGNQATDSPFATGRWSFLAAEPFGVFRVRAGEALWNEAPQPGAPLEALRSLLERYQLARDPDDSTPFRGGCIGWFAYDFTQSLERLDAPSPASGVDDVALAFYDVVAALDHVTGRVAIYSSGFPETGAAQQARAQARGAAMRDIVAAALQDAGAEPAPGSVVDDARAGFSENDFVVSHDRDAWVAAVSKVQEYIRAGDIFQANIARRFSLKLPEDFSALAFYMALRAENPAPFAAFLDFGDTVIASSSPERFMAVRERLAETRPIKGTARRSNDPEQDAAAAAALLASDKDRAENVMIVDLLRNDLSRVCAPHTVVVKSLCALESYANVHHLVSVTQGRLKENRDAIDLVAATFPGGSITGAPKIRAMDIITEIEGAARGVYCGTIGYIGFDGDMDLNIAIRTLVMRAGEAVFQAGGGITLLSDPQAEYDETEAKAARLFSAFARYGRGGPCS